MAEIIIIHGTPGSGKSTHSEKLTQFSYGGFPIFHISVGNRLRDIRTGNKDSKFSSEINNPYAPALLDHRIVNNIIFEYIEECPADSIVLVDGYPRFVDAIDIFMDSIKGDNHTLLGCINLSISLETCMSRLSVRGGKKRRKN